MSIGSGKNNFLNLASVMLPTREVVFVGNIKRENLFVSRVFQNLQVIEEWTVPKNLEICYSREIFKSKKEFNQELNDLLNLLK